MGWVAFEHKLPNRVSLHVTINGRQIQIGFNKHLYTTDDPNVIDALLNHPQCGKTFKPIETEQEFARIKAHNAARDTQYMRGPAATVEPGTTQVVTDPVDTVANDDTAVGDIAVKGTAAASKAAAKVTAKRKAPKRRGRR